MPGHNHYSSCTCGWCLKQKGLERAGRSKISKQPQITLDQITIPNAKCPVCQDSVFFYWNHHGSRVFFDDLGPPWPKHPCTIRPNAPKIVRPRIGSIASGNLKWRNGGWIPAVYDKSQRQDDWNVLYLRLLDTDEFMRVLTDSLHTPSKGGLIYLQPWDDEFRTELEFLDLYCSPARILGWKYDKWFKSTAQSALQQRLRKGKAEATQPAQRPKRRKPPKARTRR